MKGIQLKKKETEKCLTRNNIQLSIKSKRIREMFDQ